MKDLPIMRAFLLFVFCAAALGLCCGQQTTPPSGLPSDPHAILEAALPLYDFTSPDLKPWHLKANYQLYDEKENPTTQGTFERWWASPSTYRNTWTRGDASYTEWHLPEEGSGHLHSAAMLSYIERRIESALLSPLPSASTLDNMQFEKRSIGKDQNKLDCAMVAPKVPDLIHVPTGFFPTYCFAQTQPALIASFTYTQPFFEFTHIAKVQGRYLAKQLTVLSPEHKKLLTATVDMADYISASDPALMVPTEVKVFYPSKDHDIQETTSADDGPATGNNDDKAVKVNKAYLSKYDSMPISADAAQGLRTNKTQPIYPQTDKIAGISGTVVIKGTIGTDGWMHWIQVITAPSASLAQSAMDAVSQWRYKPYLINGDVVEVEDTVNITYTLGH